MQLDACSKSQQTVELETGKSLYICWNHEDCEIRFLCKLYIAITRDQICMTSFFTQEFLSNLPKVLTEKQKSTDPHFESPGFQGHI